MTSVLSSIPPVVRRSVASSPNVILALAFFVTWVEPEALGAGMHRYFTMVLLLEFITIHSAAFMMWALLAGERVLAKILRAVALGLFYTLFILAFTADGGEQWPLAAFWLLVLNRIMTFVAGEGDEAARITLATASWVWSIFWYIAAVALSVMLPMPRFGWTSEYLALHPLPGKGLWFEDPQSLMAGGFIYFTAMALFDLYSHRLTERFANIRVNLERARREAMK